jgi:hypothetical protein
MGEMRNAYKFLVGKPCGEETTLGDVGIDGRIILNRILKEVCGVKVWTRFICSEHGPVGGCCRHGNALWVSYKAENFFTS